MKRYVAFLLALVLTVGLLSGCRHEEKPSTAPEQGSSVSASADAVTEPDFSLDGKLNISWMMATQNMLSCSETPVMKYLQEKFNVSLDMTELVPADHDVQLELNISSNKVKNIVTRISIGLANEYGSYGAFVDFRPYIEAGYMPNVKAMIDKALSENPNNKSLLYDEQGHLYRIPGYNENPMPIYNFSYNAEAFAKAGYENPKTWNDVYNALKTIKAGRETFYPYKMRTLGNDQLGLQLTNFIISFTGGYANGQEFIGYDPESDSFLFAMDTKGYKEAIRFFNKMYSEGLIDPGFTTATVGNVHTAMKNGECVFTSDYMGGFTGVTGYEEYTGAFVPLSLPQADGQELTHGFRIAQFDVAAGTSVNAEVEKDPVLLGRILQILDYMYSGEFIRLQWYHPDICEGKYPAGNSDITTYEYEKDSNGNIIYKSEIYKASSVSDVQNQYFNWGIDSNFYNLNDPICNAAVHPYDSYYAFRDRLLTEQEMYVYVPLPLFTANEYKKINACESNLQTMFNLQMGGLIIQQFNSDEVFDEKWNQAVKAIREQGGDTLVNIYNTAYQRTK